MIKAQIHDIIIVGGGLAGAMLAWRMHLQNATLRVLVLEQGQTLGGNHTWSFFRSDLTVEQHKLLKPLVTKEWNSYKVLFPKFTRKVENGYASVSATQFHEVIASALGNRVRFECVVRSVDDHRVELSSGEVLTAPCIIDARGVKPSQHLVLGFQKFLGLEVKLSAPHGLDFPIIMDATVSQHDGYRFVYSLPFAPDRMLIEDTYYSDGIDLPISVLRERIAAYAQMQGWKIAQIERSEQGILPIILAGDYAAFERELAQGAVKIGLAAGLFQPTTGYSLPDAVRTCDVLLSAMAERPLTTEEARGLMLAHGRKLWRERRYFRFLNRMLFQASEPQARYKVLQRFYRLNAGLIERFYSARLNFSDKIRILSGKPPVSIRRAFSSVSETQTLERQKSKSARNGYA